MVWPCSPVFKAKRQGLIGRIEAWISQEGGPIKMPEHAQAIIREAHSKVTKALDTEIKTLRDMRSSQLLPKM